MRKFPACVFAGAIFSSIVRAADTGVPPRAAGPDYPVHVRADAAIVTAAIVPTNQVSKTSRPRSPNSPWLSRSRFIPRAAFRRADRPVAIAGYLYFPQDTKRNKSDEIELKYAKDAVAVNLPLGKP